MANTHLTFEEGTIRIQTDEDVPDLPEISGLEFDPRSKSQRVPAFNYEQIRAELADAGISVQDTVLDATPLAVESSYKLREYQGEALDAWHENGHRGVIELPTGSGKTVIGIAAIESLETATLIVVPTIDLLDQWVRELETEFETPIGRLGGGSQKIEPITVTTYDSAYLRAAELGDQFGFVIYDEVHHLGGEGYRDAARLLAAPARLGLTATFERPDGAHEAVAELIGDVLYRLDPDELAGEYLAAHDIKQIEVALTPEERTEYERNQGRFTDYLAKSNIQLRSGSDYQELVKRSGTDPEAREALLAKQRAREIMMNASGKINQLAKLLDRHDDERVLIFTAHTELVYRLSEQFLIPAITHETASDERQEILAGFREGEYSRIVTANVLDEGVDVPAANVAVLLSGSGSEREFTQRLGRILRPTEDNQRAIFYELVTEATAEKRVARRRR